MIITAGSSAIVGVEHYRRDAKVVFVVGYVLHLVGGNPGIRCWGAESGMRPHL